MEIPDTDAGPQQPPPAAAAAPAAAPDAGATASTPNTGATSMGPGSPATPSTGAAPAAQPSAVTVAPDGTAQPQSMASKVYHGILSALGGANDVTLSRDADGKMVATSVAKTPGAQWKTIIAGALTGLGAAASNAGTGPGSMTRGLGLGIQAGQHMQQQQQQKKEDTANQNYDEQQKALVRKAQLQQMAVQTAASSFSLERAGVEASSLDAKQLNDHMNWIRDNGGESVGPGTFKSFADLTAYAKNDPTLAADIAHGRIAVVPHIQDGKVAGIEAARVPDQWGNQMNDKPLPIDRMGPAKDGGPPTWTTEMIPAGTIKNSDYNAAVLATVAQRAKVDGDKVENDYRKSQIRNQNSETAEHYATANKTRVETKNLTEKDANDPEVAQLGEGIARGNLTEDQIPGFGKKKAAVEAYLTQHHPNLDQKSVILDAGQRKQVNLAKNAIHNLDDITTRLQKRTDLLGVISGRVSQGKELAGTNDADLTDINTALDNYALASTGAHGIRAVQARADAKKALLNGFKNGPQGFLASAQAARSSLQNLASAGTPRGMNGSPYVYTQQQPGAPATGGAPGAPAGASSEVYATDGKTLIGHVVNGQYVALGK